MAEPIDIGLPFRMRTRVSQVKHVLGRGPDPSGERINFWGEAGVFQTIVSIGNIRHAYCSKYLTVIQQVAAAMRPFAVSAGTEMAYYVLVCR